MPRSPTLPRLPCAGVVFPAAGPTTKATGASVTACGPVTGFRLEVDAGPEAQVVLSTPLAEYILLKPAPGYKKTFGNLFVQAALVREVSVPGLCVCRGGQYVSLRDVYDRPLTYITQCSMRPLPPSNAR